MLLIKRAASECETRPTLELSERPALIIVRRAHHRRCAREGLTGRYDASQSGWMQGGGEEFRKSIELARSNPIELSVILHQAHRDDSGSRRQRIDQVIGRDKPIARRNGPQPYAFTFFHWLPCRIVQREFAQRGDDLVAGVMSLPNNFTVV